MKNEKCFEYRDKTVLYENKKKSIHWASAHRHTSSPFCRTKNKVNYTKKKTFACSLDIFYYLFLVLHFKLLYLNGQYLLSLLHINFFFISLAFVLLHIQTQKVWAEWGNSLRPFSGLALSIAKWNIGLEPLNFLKILHWKGFQICKKIKINTLLKCLCPQHFRDVLHL